MLKFKYDIDSVGEAADKDLLERVPDAVAVFVLDGKGDLVPFRLSSTRVARRVEPKDVGGLVENANLEFKRTEHVSFSHYEGRGCELVVCGGDYVWIC
ncbi:MAG: hypothetical protein ACREV2_20795 [Burkholderiales bacterium]